LLVENSPSLDDLFVPLVSRAYITWCPRPRQRLSKPRGSRQ
jgi:hypothetical protein